MFWRRKAEMKEVEKVKAEKQPDLAEMPEMVIKEAEETKAEKLPKLVEMPEMVIKEVEKVKPKVEKLPGPKEIPELVARHLVIEKKRDPDWVWRLKAVVRQSSKGVKEFDVRVFDEAEAAAKKITVKDYTSFDEQPGLILYEGWFDKESRRVELEEKRIMQEVPIFSKAEIQQKVEALSEPGSTVFFYLGASPSIGGPLGRGAAVVELNPNYPGKGKRYIVYISNVEGVEPVGKQQKWFDSDKSKEIAGVIKERHYKLGRSGY